jgi:hypothetical protein
MSLDTFVAGLAAIANTHADSEMAVDIFVVSDRGSYGNMPNEISGLLIAPITGYRPAWATPTDPTKRSSPLFSGSCSEN